MSHEIECPECEGSYRPSGAFFISETCPLCGGIGVILTGGLRAMEHTEPQDRERGVVAALNKQLACANEKLAIAEKALEGCYRNDGSEDYEYGEKNRKGIKPGIGQRWLTPREISKQALKEMERIK